MCFRLFLLTFLLLAPVLRAAGQQPSEANLIADLFRSLQYNNSERYEDLFPRADSLASWALRLADRRSDFYQKMAPAGNNIFLQNNLDSSLRRQARDRFISFLKKAKKLRIYWSETIFMRYELEEHHRKGGLFPTGIPGNRFTGYVFFKDQLTRKVYCFTLLDILQVGEQWYGGGLINIFEAHSKEGYKKALAEERRLQMLLAAGDSTAIANAGTEEEEEDSYIFSPLKEIAERKYYRGYFDEEIKVELYVRHFKGPCEGGICEWDALFRFGDEETYVKMDVSKSPGGTWVFTDELGSMELTLKDQVFTGSYVSSSDKTEYDVHFKEAPARPRKLYRLDTILRYESEEE